MSIRNLSSIPFLGEEFSLKIAGPLEGPATRREVDGWLVIYVKGSTLIFVLSNRLLLFPLPLTTPLSLL